MISMSFAVMTLDILDPGNLDVYTDRHNRGEGKRTHLYSTRATHLTAP